MQRILIGFITALGAVAVFSSTAVAQRDTTSSLH